jgi:hypothetical protein
VAKVKFFELYNIVLNIISIKNVVVQWMKT